MEQKREKQFESGNRNFLGTIALLVGMVFIILAGCMFATTTWHMLGKAGKLSLAAVSAAGFFAASLLTGEKLGIRRTSMACHILGSIFLALLPVTAGYFHMLGEVFSVHGDGWWCVLGTAALILAGAMALGIRRFGSGRYGRLNLAVFLFGSYYLMRKCLEIILERLTGWQTGTVEVAVFGGIALLCLTAAGFLLSRRCKMAWAGAASALVYAEGIHYAAAFLPAPAELRVFLMAASMAVCFSVSCIRRRVREGEAGPGLHAMAYSAVLLADTGLLALLELAGESKTAAELELLAALLLVILVMREWGKRIILMRMLIPFVIWYLVIPAGRLFTGITGAEPDYIRMLFIEVCILAVWDVGKKDAFGLGILTVSGIMIPVTILLKKIGLEPYWYGVWLGMTGIYGCAKFWRGCGTAAAFSLVLLTIGSLLEGGLAGGLLLEGACLILSFMAQKKQRKRWAEVSGGLLAAAAVYMTRGFWMEMAWWMYLLIAGIGLIIFGAMKEKHDSF